MDKPTNPSIFYLSFLASRSGLAEKMTKKKNESLVYTDFFGLQKLEYLKGKEIERDHKILTAACTHISIPNEKTI